MRLRRFLGLLALLVLVILIVSFRPGRDGNDRREKPARKESPAAIAEADRRLRRDIAALAPQRPGHPDLYVLGIAGDGTERVFLNEVRHLRDVAERRLDAAGRVIVLSNHAAETPYRAPVPATAATLRTALAGIGAAMDPAEDILLLYVTTHGSDDHWLLLRREELADARLDADTLRGALDDAGIRHRVLVLSACYSGGLVPALQDPDTLVLTAARADRTSFGCGNDSVATFFGRAWLVDGLNGTADFASAFRQARADIREREHEAALEPSRPQIHQGERIRERLLAWQAAFQPGPAVPYPHAEPVFEDVDLADGEWGEADIVPPWLPLAQLARIEAEAIAAAAAGDSDELEDSGELPGSAAPPDEAPLSAAADPAGDRPSKP